MLPAPHISSYNKCYHPKSHSATDQSETALILLFRFPCRLWTRPRACSDTLPCCIIPFIQPITSVQEDPVMTVMGNKDDDFPVECRPCQEPVLSVVIFISKCIIGETVNCTLIRFQRVHMMTTLRVVALMLWSCLFFDCSWTAPTLYWCICRWGLVHVEVAFQNPFLEMIRLSGRLWYLLDWLFSSWHTGSLLVTCRTHRWSRRYLATDWSRSFSSILDLLRPVEPFT